MSEIQNGDAVQLKSGGPIMTVEDVGNYSGMGMGPKNGVKCVRFEKTTPKSKVFDAAVLVKSG